MRTGTPFTVCIALLVLAAAGAAEWRARQHRQQGDWQLARATAHADGYVRTFDGAHIDAELAALGERRAALTRAERWEQARALAVLLAALLALVAYGQWFLGQLEALRLDGPRARPARGAEEPPPAVAGAAQP